MILAIFLIFLAGLASGSFAMPTKYITKWRFENIWLPFSIWGFLIIPWLIAFLLTPKLFSIYAATPTKLIWIIISGGFLFGVGQTLFAIALNLIGLGLGFIFNVGIGMALGFLLPLVFQHPEKILTPFGMTTIFGTTLALIGLAISNHAGLLRDRSREINGETGQLKIAHILGVCLSALGGMLSSGQNFVLSLTGEVKQIALNMGTNHIGAAAIIWPIFLTAVFIPYASYMLFLNQKNRSFNLYRGNTNIKSYLLTFIMGCLWYGATFIYSQATQLIGELGPIIGWPLFMVIIILTSSFWGWRHHEWTYASNKAKRTMQLGLLFLLISMAILGYNGQIS